MNPESFGSYFWLFYKSLSIVEINTCVLDLSRAFCGSCIITDYMLTKLLYSYSLNFLNILFIFSGLPPLSNIIFSNSSLILTLLLGVVASRLTSWDILYSTGSYYYISTPTKSLMLLTCDIMLFRSSFVIAFITYVLKIGYSLLATKSIGCPLFLSYFTLSYYISNDFLYASREIS
mgnify:FL=1